MLEVGGVVHARAEQDSRRLRHRLRRDVLQHVEQRRRIVVVGKHVVVVEQRRKHPLDDLSVLQHVADARRCAGVVLEHEVFTVGGPNEVGAADVDVDPSRHIHADKLAAEEGPLQHEPGGHHAVPQDVLLVVDIPEKEVECVDPLGEAGLDLPPFRGRNDPRHRVHRPHPFDALLGTVDREADAVLPHRKIGHRLAAAEILRARLQQPLVERLIVGAGHRLAGPQSADHFVVGRAEFIAGEEALLRGNRALRARTEGSGRGLVGTHPPFSSA